LTSIKVAAAQPRAGAHLAVLSSVAIRRAATALEGCVFGQKRTRLRRAELFSLPHDRRRCAMLAKTAQFERSHLELTAIYEICRILGGTLDIHRSYRAALNVLSAHLELHRLMVVSLDDDGQLSTMSSVGLTSEHAGRGHWKPGEGIIGTVFNTGMAVVVPDVRDAPEFLDRTGAFGAKADERHAFIVVPLKTDRHVLGVLAAQRQVEGLARLSDDQRVLTMAATLIAQHMQLHRAVKEEHRRLQEVTSRVQKARPPRARQGIADVVGNSPRMQQVFAEVHQAAPSRATVLLRGESGTGKEAIARAIHQLSPRKDAPFIKVNCAALSETLLESELFGHDRGAFTGANGDRKGRFELAHGGTLFLDEVGDISSAFQAKLLRVLQEREFERVGGNRTIKVDVRLVCATNRNLEKMVQRGEYRADLYYRINVVSISLPALRERREDIPALVNHFVERYNKENHRELTVAPDAMKVLTHCYWPGNVRELENCIERTATMAQGDTISDTAFPCQHQRCLTKTLHDADKEDAVAPVRATIPIQPVPLSAADAPVRIGPGEHLADAMPERRYADGGPPPAGERERLIWAMEQCGWVQAKAARLLKVTPRQMGYALQRHRIEVRKL
jgi:Nif-specific regulatory protein